jgi:hypothetical protein
MISLITQARLASAAGLIEIWLAPRQNDFALFFCRGESLGCGGCASFALGSHLCGINSQSLKVDFLLHRV